MDTTKICPRCRTPLPGDAPGGLCPRCLMDMNLATETEVTGAGDLPKATPSPEELATKFPQLEILGLLGRGGMGAVYKARQKELDRIVALKILPPSVGDDPAFAERFAREAKALAKLSHSNIVTLFEFGRADGLYYFLMEFVDGVNLRQLLQTGRVSPREALAIVPQICDALQYAHDQGIVHRDIKPENILMDRRGRVKVADFGLAKLMAATSFESEQAKPTSSLKPTSGSSGLTDPNKVMGTPQYMAPEQKESPLEVDHRADIYALGVVFYQMLTGELPGKRIEPPSKKVQVDVRLDEIVLRALESTPERRYQSAEELKTGVETIVSREAAKSPNSQLAPARKPVLWIAYACFLFGTVGQLAIRNIFHTNELNSWLISAVALSVAAVLGTVVWKHWLGKGIIVGSLLVMGMTTFDIAREKRRVPLPSIPSVPESQLATEPSQSTVVSNATFGELIERTINDDGAKEDFFVDLDTGRSFTPPPALKLGDANAFLNWSRSNGIDVMGETSQSVRGLLGFEFAARPIPRARWETVSAGEVLADEITQAQGGLAPTTLTAKGELPESFIFKTREGGSGILQITGFAENPRSVKVRYKMVQDRAAPAREEKPALPIGKVVERVLLDPDNYGGRNQDTLQLRSGELSLVAGAAPKDGGGRLWALAASHGDLFAEYDNFVSKKWALVGTGLKLSDLLASQWETATMADIEKALGAPTALQHVEHGGVTLYMLPEEMLPLTLAFEARDGSRGVLQVTGYGDNPHSVKIRYRLLRTARGKEQSNAAKQDSSDAAQYDYRRMIQIDSVIVHAPKEVWNWLTHSSYNAEKLATDPRVKMLRGPRVDTEEGKEATLHLFSGATGGGDRPQHDVVRVRATLDGERIRHSVKGHFTKVDDTWTSPANITDDVGLVDWDAPMIYGLPSEDNDRTRVAVLTISPVLRPRLLDAENKNKHRGTRAIFGPVIEKSFDGQTNILLNLTQSRVLSVPPEAAPDEFERRILSDEVDFMFGAGQVADLPVLNWEMRTRLEAARLRDSSFEDVTVEEISEALASNLLSRVSFGFPLGGPIAQSSTRYDTFSADDYPPKTFAFRTADNKIGVLEVVSFTTDIHPPQEMVIRYKFLQTEQTAAASPAPRDFKIVLANGVAFEVVAICRNPRESQQWWKPDGTLFANPPVEILELPKLAPTRSANITVDQKKEFLIYIEQRWPDEWPKDVKRSVSSRWTPTPSDSEFPPRLRDLRTGKITQETHLICFDNLPPTVDYQAEVASGPWEAIATYDGKETRELANGVMVVCSVVAQREKTHRFEVMHNVNRDSYAMRLVAKMKNGKTREVDFHDGPLSGSPAKGFALIHASDFDPKEVKEYVIERAAKSRGVIEEIALRPRTEK